MRLRSPGFWLTLLTVSGVLAFVWSQREQTSPGALSAVHAGVEELANGAACEACHGGSGTDLADACAECHADVADSIAARVGVHGALVGDDLRSCGRCHLEHHGLSSALNGDLAFRRLGFENSRAFDHAGLGFPLDGLHADLSCDACHENAFQERIAHGTRRFLGESAACSACHEDVHEGKMLRSCEECHSVRAPFLEVSAHEHSDLRIDSGAHASLRCSECHVRGSGFEVEVVMTRGMQEWRRCSDCHESNHGASFLAAATADLGEEASCGACHSVDPGGFGETRSLPAAWHAWTGFALDAPHASVDCAGCHADGDYAPRAVPRKAQDCATCHIDPHEAQFGERSCVECHAETHFAPTRFDVELHAATSFPLDASHAAVACDSCHVDTGAKPRMFRGTSTSCDACHDDAHGGLLIGNSIGCAECHVPTRFADVDVAAFDHRAHTRFALTGAHVEASCESCHQRTPHADAFDRTFGRAVTRGDAVAGCEECHADAHAGAFDAVLASRPGTDPRSCANCHSTTSFGAASHDFEHGLWTGWELAGAHAAAACEACHERSARPDATGRRFGRVHEVFGHEVRRCDDCHAPAHGSLFEFAAGAAAPDCSVCHDESAFVPPVHVFDHGLWTGMQLEGPHGAASCEACHPPVPGEGRRLGPAKGNSCVACHSDPHVGQFEVAGATDCAECHTTSGETHFDHERQSRFSLAGPHAQVACAECHLTFTFEGLGEIVRYKPLAQDCGDCHAPGGGR